MLRTTIMICTFILAMTATTSAANATVGQCLAQFDQDMAACGGNSSCEQQANINLGVCLASLDDWIDDCAPGDRC